MTGAAHLYRSRIVDHELDELLDALPAVAIEGAKAVGKTATATRRARSAHHLDDPGQRAIALGDLTRVLRTPPPVLIDEWQYVPPVWDSVRRAVDAGASAGSFLLTGSAAPKVTGTHSGGGRIVNLRMRPLSLAERLGEPPSVSLASLLGGGRKRLLGRTGFRLEDYVEEILRSGFPGLRSLAGRPLRRALDAYIDRIVDRDFPELGHAAAPASLRRWMAAYAAATSTSTSFEKIRNAAGADPGAAPARTTARPYRDVLERLFVIDDVPGWQPSRNPITGLGLPPKHHLVDPALTARLLSATTRGLLEGRPATRDGTLLGALFESLVTQSVRVYAQAAEARVAHLRTHRGGHEIDLIIERDDGRVVAMEIKLASTPTDQATRHLRWLADQIGDDLIDAVIVTTGEEAYRRADGIAVVPAALLGP